MIRLGVLSYQNCKSHGIGVNLGQVRLAVFWIKNSKNHSLWISLLCNSLKST